MHKIIFHDAIKNKIPDLRINQILVEEEHLLLNKEYNFYIISRLVKNGRKQAYYVIVNLEKSVNNKVLKRVAEGGFKISKFLK